MTYVNETRQFIMTEMVCSRLRAEGYTQEDTWAFREWTGCVDWDCIESIDELYNDALFIINAEV